MKRPLILLLTVLLTVALSGACSCIPEASGSSSPYSVHIPSQQSGKISSAEYASTPDTGITVPYTDPEIITTFDIQVSDYYYRRLDSEKQRKMYGAMLTAVISVSAKTASVQGEFTSEELKEVYSAVNNDYPQFFELGDYYTGVTETDWLGRKSTYCELTFVAQSTQEALQRRRELYGAVNDILAAAANINDVLSRELFLYDAVLNSGRYDYDELEVIGRNPDAHTAYGCLVDGVTVCDGYARAFALLCNYAGIECRVIEGRLGLIRHAWNAVTLGGSVYYCDATADDIENRYRTPGGSVVQRPENPQGMTRLDDIAAHGYFNVTYAELAIDHESDVGADPSDADSAADGIRGVMPLYTDTDSLTAGLAKWFSESGSGGFEFALAQPVDDIAEYTRTAAQRGGFTGSYAFYYNSAKTRYYIFLYN